MHYGTLPCTQDIQSNCEDTVRLIAISSGIIVHNSWMAPTDFLLHQQETCSYEFIYIYIFSSEEQVILCTESF